MKEVHFINKSAVKGYLHTFGSPMSSTVTPQLERVVTAILDRAVKRATKNQRTTVMGRDV